MQIPACTCSADRPCSRSIFSWLSRQLADLKRELASELGILDKAEGLQVIRSCRSMAS